MNTPVSMDFNITTISPHPKWMGYFSKAKGQTNKQAKQMNINVNKDFMKQEFFTMLKQMSLQKMYFLCSSANIQKFCASRSLIFHVGLFIF